MHCERTELTVLTLATTLALLLNGARQVQGGAVTFYPVSGYDCHQTCTNNGGKIALNGGLGGRALCRASSYYIGTKTDASSACQYSPYAGSTSTTYTYECGCRVSGSSLSFQASTSCPSGQTSSASPSICRVIRPDGSGDVVMGWLDGSVCRFPSRPWGTGGGSLTSVLGAGGTYNMQMLCETYDPCSGISCGNHGYCSGGSCYCYSPYSWTGSFCALTNCGSNGYYDSSSDSCKCYSGYSWDGSRCKGACEGISCGNHGYCSGGSCYCTGSYSWSGTVCALYCGSNGYYDSSSDSCKCYSGYTWDGSSCTAANPCLSNNGGCSSNAYCTNYYGVASCSCKSGYTGNGYTCTVTNPCLTNNGGCSSNANCANNGGVAICSCKTGYTGNGYTCSVVNPCLSNNGGCSSNANCANNGGVATCSCKSGYTGNGYTCSAIGNPCLTNNGGCSSNANCANTNGFATCSCKTGYTGNGYTCTVVNPCLTNNGGCSSNANCANNNGAAVCTCKTGFSPAYVGSTLTCVLVNSAPCSCNDSPGGVRLVLSQTAIYQSPCSTSTIKRYLQSCETITYTGKKSTSTCLGTKDSFCWVQVSKPDSGWVRNFDCTTPQNGLISMYPNYAVCRKCSNVQPTRDGILQLAKSVVGQPTYYTQGNQRWEGITKAVCPAKAPYKGDCSSFVTWLYWTAFGIGPDLLNHQSPDWSGGYTGSMLGADSKQVARSPYTKGRYDASKMGTSQPGDLVFYGAPPHSHVALYVGNSRVITWSGSKEGDLRTIQELPITYHPNLIDEVRSYSFFGSSSAALRWNVALAQAVTTGASAATARQDNLPYFGVPASHKMAEADLAANAAFKDIYKIAGAELNIPIALIAALASRESRAGALLDRNGYGDNGNGYGLLQVDKRYHQPLAGLGNPKGAAHIRQALSIFADYVKTVTAEHPSWPDWALLKGACVAYNSGTKNVQTIDGMDKGTTGNDYGSDVVARAQYYSSHGF